MDAEESTLTGLAREHAPSVRRGLTLLTLCLAVLIAQIDTSVVNLAIRPIGVHFQAGVGALQWVVDSYNLVYAVLLLTGGLLADLYGRRLLFMAGAAVFTAASLICALAPWMSVLIAGRALAGLGAAFLLPASLAVIRVVWPDEQERGRALGLWAACNGLAFVIGAPLGGMLISLFNWRSIFFVVVPFGLAALGLAMASIPESSDPQGRHFDAGAQILGMVALGGLALAAIESHGAFRIAVAALVAALVALVLFIRTERAQGKAALVPLDLFGVGAFRGTVVATAGMTFGMYGVLFLMPLTWQSTGRLDPTSAGLGLIPMALTFAIVSPFSGVLTETFGSRNTTAGGVAIIGLGLPVIAATAHLPSLIPSEIGLALTGLGMGFATGPLMAVAVGAVDASRSGTAAALINVARMVGATIGVATLGALFATAESYAGLRLALIVGGAVQIACAAFAWAALRNQ